MDSRQHHLCMRIRVRVCVCITEKPHSQKKIVKQESPKNYARLFHRIKHGFDVYFMHMLRFISSSAY